MKNKGEEHLANRGYGASSRITAHPGVGFVDLTSFLLAKSDLITPSVSFLFGRVVVMGI